MSYIVGVATTWDEEGCKRKERRSERESAWLKGRFCAWIRGEIKRDFSLFDWNMREYFKRFCEQQKQTKHGGTYKYSTDKQQYHLSGIVEGVYVRENRFVKSKLTGDRINILMLSSKCKNSSNQTHQMHANTVRSLSKHNIAKKFSFLNQYFCLVFHWKPSKYP